MMRRVWIGCVLAVVVGVASVVVPTLVSVAEAAPSCSEPLVSVWDPAAGAPACVPAGESGTRARAQVLCPFDTVRSASGECIKKTSPSPWPRRIGVAVAGLAGLAAVFWWLGYIEVRAEMREAAFDGATDEDDDEDDDGLDDEDLDGAEFADPQSTEGAQQEERQLLLDELIADELRQMRDQGH